MLFQQGRQQERGGSRHYENRHFSRENRHKRRLMPIAFLKLPEKMGILRSKDRLFTGETVITYGFGHLVELDSPDMYDENGNNGH